MMSLMQPTNHYNPFLDQLAEKKGNTNLIIQSISHIRDALQTTNKRSLYASMPDSLLTLDSRDFDVDGAQGLLEAFVHLAANLQRMISITFSPSRFKNC